MKKLYILFLFAAIGVNAQGSLCTDPIVISSLPFSTTGDTANYGDNYDPTPGTEASPACATTLYGNNYHGGNDVIYSYTPAISGTISLSWPAAIAWTGMFIYTSCANIGLEYAACATGASAGDRNITNFAVTAGATYYILISTWPTPQTSVYTLNITGNTMAVGELSKPNAVRLYPNPVTENLNVEADFSLQHATVYNVNGQRLEVKMTNNEIQTSHLQSGFYILELTTDSGIQIRKNFIKATK